jgi:type II secretory pathway pseudopilin PulG
MLLISYLTDMRHHSTGFSLVEMVVYIALLAIIGTVLTLFASQLLNRNTQAQLNAGTLNNAQQIIEVLSHELREANGVYYPTSVFDVHPGQLSLATTKNLPADENLTYVDFYVDDDRLYRKRESQAAELVTSQNVKITKLVFTHVNGSSNQSAVRIELTVAPDTASAKASAQGSASISTSVSLRAY